MHPAVAFPVIGDSHSPDESEGSVDHQNFSMRPKVDAREMNEAENLHRDTRAFHQLDGASVYRITSERILKKMHLHTITGAFRKRSSESVRDFAFPEKEIFKCNATLRRTYAVQHSREDLIPIFQRCNFVPFLQRRSEQVAHGADESVVADIVVSSDGMADFLLRRKEIPDHEQSSQTACGGGAEQLRPLR